MNLLYLILLAFAYFPADIAAARILAMFAYPGRSHWNFYRPLLLALAENGHNVTVVGHYPQRPAKSGYTDISLAGTFQNAQNSISIQDLIKNGKYVRIKMQWEVHGYKTCEAMYNNKEIQDLAKSTAKYDLLITELFGGDCFHPFAYKFKIPLIGITSSVIQPFSADFINLPENPSYIPSYAVPFSNDMNLWQRAVNAITLIGCKLGYHQISRVNTDRLARQLFPDMPPLLEISNNISLIISNTHFSLNGAKPGVPALVEAAGMHISKLNDFPVSLHEILNNSAHGVVYFSFGSLVKSETLPKETLKTLISVFSTLKQKVLWKVDGKLAENLPKNIITEPWVPQLDVLCHPNVKAFITHGGMLSSQEAVYCGVPMIGIPLFADQDHNIKNFESQGFAVHLDLYNITEKSVKYVLSEVLENPKYKWNANRVSALFRDRPKKPLDEAVYWTEYVIRHKGAHHLQTSAKNLNWFQYFLLDVFAVFSLALFIIAVMFILFIRYMWKRFFNRDGKRKVKLY